MDAARPAPPSATSGARLFVIHDVGTHGELDRLAPAIEAVLAAAAPDTIALVARDQSATSDRARLARLVRLRALTDAHGAALVVSARVDLALACGADGVQLPERGLPADVVRAWLGAASDGPRLAIGRSCHDRAGLVRAETDGASWAFLAPVFAPHSKPPSGPPLGVPGFAAAVAGLRLPVVALGGLRPADVHALVAAGARGVATLGAILGTPDPAARAREFVAALGDARPTSVSGSQDG